MTAKVSVFYKNSDVTPSKVITVVLDIKSPSLSSKFVLYFQKKFQMRHKIEILLY